jgi:ubiquinone/menaquinone biosynthesis C-methylase UbiE
MDQNATQAGYDRVAAEYARRIYGELAHKPLDRQLLERFADQVRGKGPVCDLGCGPGQIARFLRDQGVVEAFGLDLSPGMIEQAQQLNPDLQFRVGNMRSLPAEENSWAGIAAFYSIIHIAREEVTGVLREWRRVLQPGGVVLLAFHVGDEVIHLDEWMDETVSIDFVFFRRDEMESYLTQAGFEIEESIQRSPYKEVEHPSQRSYIFARNPQEVGR